MAGPAMPMLALAVAMMTSQQASSTALPAKQRPDVMPTVGTSPLSRGNWWNVSLVPPRIEMKSGSLPRPPPPSVKITVGNRHFSAISYMRSCFAWLFLPCVPAITV